MALKRLSSINVNGSQAAALVVSKSEMGEDVRLNDSRPSR